MRLETKLALGGLALLAVWLFVVLPIAHNIDSSKISWTAIAAGAAAISAVASAFSAWASLYNTRTFERQLRNSTIDACISAAIDLRGAINSAIRVKAEFGGNTPSKVWDAYTEAWSKWRAFTQTFTVVKRYVGAGFHPKNPDEALADLLKELRTEFASADWTAAHRASFFEQKAKAILGEVISELESVPVAGGMTQDSLTGQVIDRDGLFGVLVFLNVLPNNEPPQHKLSETEIDKAMRVHGVRELDRQRLKTVLRWSGFL